MALVPCLPEHTVSFPASVKAQDDLVEDICTAIRPNAWSRNKAHGPGEVMTVAATVGKLAHAGNDRRSRTRLWVTCMLETRGWLPVLENSEMGRGSALNSKSFSLSVSYASFFPASFST